MFDRFTDRARKVMGLAREEAQQYHHQYIGTEHILLALAREGNGVAANVLARSGVGVPQLRTAIKIVLEEGPTMVTMGQLPFTPRTKAALEHASEAAQRLKHNYIGTEHLLLGIIEAGGNAAAKVLEQAGVAADQLRQNVLETLGSVDEPAGADITEVASVTFDRYQEFTRSVAVYPGAGTGSFDAMTYVALKGAGECGEFAEKLGKRMRKSGTIGAISRESMDDEFRLELAKELGDRLWYISQAAAELGFTLSEIARINVEKLTSRKDRGVLIGEGDNR